MKNQQKNLLSKSAIENLGLLKPDPVVYLVEVESVKQEFPRLFKGLGLLKELYRIPLREIGFLSAYTLHVVFLTLSCH